MTAHTLSGLVTLVGFALFAAAVVIGLGSQGVIARLAAL